MSCIFSALYAGHDLAIYKRIGEKREGTPQKN